MLTILSLVRKLGNLVQLDSKGFIDNLNCPYVGWKLNFFSFPRFFFINSIIFVIQSMVIGEKKLNLLLSWLVKKLIAFVRKGTTINLDNFQIK